MPNNLHEPFDFSKVVDFDSHIKLSIPNYEGLMDVFTALHLEFMPPMGKCIDIGCSTGRLLNNLSRTTQGEYLGVDRVRMASEYEFTFFEEDCVEFFKNTDCCDVLISSFTLQFLGKHHRKELLQEIKRLIEGGTIFLLSEKVYSNCSKVNTVLWREHIRQKRKSFSSDEILDKDYSLFGSMFCNTDEQMTKELSEIGKATQVWQSYNFKGWIIQ